jgi:gas vesicle protein
MSEVTAPQSGAAGPAPPQNQGGAEQAKEKAGEVAGQAQEKAQEAAGQAKGRAREEIDRRSTEAGQQVKTTADDIRSVGDQLREQGKDGPAKIADQAAERAQKLGGYLEDSDADRILRDVEDLARRQPWAVVAGGVVLGFAAARFLKASSSQRYQQSYGSGSSPNGLANGSGYGRTALPSEGIGADGRQFTDPGTPATGATGVVPSSGVTPDSR